MIAYLESLADELPKFWANLGQFWQTVIVILFILFAYSIIRSIIRSEVLASILQYLQQRHIPLAAQPIQHLKPES